MSASQFCLLKGRDKFLRNNCTVLAIRCPEASLYLGSWGQREEKCIAEVQRMADMTKSSYCMSANV